MNITKIGHCCLLIKIDELTLLTDPGNYNTCPTNTGIDVVIITHEHGDHCHIDSLKIIRAKNPEVEIITHKSVGALLEAENIPYTRINSGKVLTRKGITIQSIGSKHACIHHDLPPVQNTGFLLNNALFYPGDSFELPLVPVETLALPVAGPWMKLEECIEYAKEVMPKKVFPVHDGMLRQEHQLGPTRRIPTLLLEPLGIEYVDMQEGDTKDF
jgi:L-ascorbate metabolism protein UlaG (beta-lactamase superfamily)